MAKTLGHLVTIKQKRMNSIEEPIGVSEAAALLGVSEITVYRNAAKGTLPSYKRLGKWYFFASELIAWIRGGRLKTQKEVDRIVDAAISSHTT